MELTIKDVVDHAKTIANGDHDVVKPGMPQTFSDAATDGDMIWQGDLGIGITSGGIPDGYKRIEMPENLCLVPGTDDTIGSRHCLATSEGVEVYVPEVWDETVLDGPYLRVANGATVTHPKHGDVTIPSCFNEVQIIYQREMDEETKRERRAKD
jgi:hypothetical protein